MDEISNSNNSIYPSIDSSITCSGGSSFNKKDGEDALRRMGHGLFKCQLQRTPNHHAGGFRLYRDLHIVAEIEDPETKAVGKKVDMQTNDENVVPRSNAVLNIEQQNRVEENVAENGVTGTDTILDNVQINEDQQTDDEVVMHRESSTESSASEKRLQFRQSGEFWQTEGDFHPVDVADEAEDNVEASVQRGMSYKRQTSDTGSLPDVILSISSTTETSPDLMNLDDSNGNCSKLNTDLSTAAASDQNCASSASATADRKFVIEGRVNDPKALNFHRQVSFNKQVSVREIDGIDRLDQLDKDMIDGGQDTHAEVFSSIPCNECSADTSTYQSRHVNQIRTNNAEDKRHNYSDRTSGYGTGSSSKNSQTGSSETQSVCNISTDTIASDEIHECDSHITEQYGMPFLSIFERKSSGTLSSSNQSVGSVVPGKAGGGTPESSVISDTSTFNQAGLPILSILNDDSSVVVSPLGLTYSRSVDDTLLNNMPPEVQRCLLSPGSEGMGNRSTDFDKHALDTLSQFQRSNSTPLKQPLSSTKAACISPNNGHRALSKSQSFPLKSKDTLARMRDELFLNYTEDLLFNMNHNSPAIEFESVIQKIRTFGIGTSDSSSPSPITPLTPLIQQGYAGSPKQNQKKFSFQTLILCPEGKLIQAKMLQASRCRSKRCPLQDCKMGKEIFSQLNHSMQTRLSDVTYANHTLPLIALLDHSLTCDEMRCTMPWCTFLHWRLNLNSAQNSEEINPRQVMKVLTQFAQLPTLRFTSLEGRDETLYKLDSQFPLSTVTEGVDWIAMVRMGTYGGSVMATTTTSLNHWIIKKIHLTHTEDSRLDVYRNLRDHNSPHIVSYLWMKQPESGKLLHVCYLCERGGSLHELLQSRGPLSPESALCNFRQILDAAIFLHQRQILYLYWTAKNVLLGMNGSQAVCKLCNFSAAVCLTGNNYDIEDVKCWVPAVLLPLELILGDDLLCIEVDSWGLGCLLTELLTSQPARQDLIHEDRCAILEKLENDSIPKKPDIGNAIVDQILNNCWQINPYDRMSAARLKGLIDSFS